MDSTLATLRERMYQYRDVDDKKHKLNKELAEVRSRLNELEGEIIRIVDQPEFQEVKELEIKDDGSRIKIQRPDTWNKAWTLSKKDLEKYIHSYFEGTTLPNGFELMDYIVENQKKRLVSKEYSLTRIVINNDNSK